MDVCVVFVVRTLIWNVKCNEGRNDLNSTKMDQKGEKPPDSQKKKKYHRGHGCLCFFVKLRLWTVSDMKGRKRTNTEQK
jgi:hypothetical protein